MPEYDGEVIIHAELDKGDFESNIDRLTRLLGEKKSQIESLKAQYASFAKGENKTQEQLNAENKINQLLEKRNQIVSKLWGSKNVTASEMVKLNTELNSTNIALDILKKKLDNIEISPTSTQSVKNIAREIENLKKESIKLNNVLNDTLGKQASEKAKAYRFAKSQQAKADLEFFKANEKFRNNELKAEEMFARTQASLAAKSADLSKRLQTQIEIANINAVARAKSSADSLAKEQARISAQSAIKQAQIESNQIISENKNATQIAINKEKNATNLLAVDKRLAAQSERNKENNSSREIIADKNNATKIAMNKDKITANMISAENKNATQIAMNREKITANFIALDRKLQARAEIEQAKMEERAQVRAQRAQALASRNTKTFGDRFKSVFSSLSSPIDFVISKITELGKRILRIGSFVLVFNIIRGAFRQFRDYVSAALITNSEFMTSLNKIKSNLMVAFYPIYQYILPALNTLMSILVKASSYLANFFSLLTGTNIKQSVAGAKSIYEQQQAMKSTGTATASTTKSIKDQKAEFDKLGKSIKGSKKELAAFDKIMVLSQNKEKTSKIKTPKSDGFVFTPSTDIPEPNLKWMDNFIKNLRGKLKPTIESFEILGDTIRDKIGKFAKNAIEDFNREYLEPMSNYLFKKAIPKFNQITTDMINGTDWDNLNTSLNNFWKSLEPFNETIGNGLLAFYENVISPFSQWAVGNLIPASLDALRGALDLLNPVAQQSGDYLGKLYETFLKPAAKWTGESIVNGLKGIGSSLSTIGDWIEKNSWFVEIVASLITGITTALIGYNTVMFITSGALAATATSAWAFTTALLANPITWIVGLIGLLISALIELGIHWDDVKQSGVNFFNAIKNSIQNIIKWFKWLGDEIGKFFGMFKFFGKGVNFSPQDQFAFSKFKPFTSQIPKRIPGFAQGAVLKGGDPMLAYLNDQPRGQTNIETPLNTMIQAFNEALARNNNAPGNVVIQADGDVAGIVDMLRFNIKKQDELIGTNYIQDGIFA